MENDKKNHLFLIILIISLSVAGAVIIPNWMRAPQGGWFLRCISNVKNIGTALEMYAKDNEDLYPSDLATLTPRYLKVIPDCAATDRDNILSFLRDEDKGRDTYSTGYQVSKDRKHFTVYCNGENHKAVGIKTGNWPQYNSEEGLRARP